MARERTPWFRASKDAWFVQFNGKQVLLAKGRGNRQEAMTAFYKLMATAPDTPRPGKILVIQVCDLFLQWSETHHVKHTFDLNKHYLQKFCNFQGNGRLLVTEFKPFHVTRWVDHHPHWTGARRTVIGIVKRAFSWAEAEGLIALNPIQRMKKPPGGCRSRVLTVEERQQIRDAVDDESFLDFITALEETGCRPGEVAAVTAADADLKMGVWVLHHHKTAKKTGRPRVVYLTPKLMDLTARLIAKYPTGPLFRGKSDRPLNKNAIRCRFRRLREKLPHLGHFISYTFRASFATAALENGVGVAQVAELLGHTSTDMVMRHYGHLNQRVQHMRAMAEQATKVQNGPDVAIQSVSTVSANGTAMG